MDLDAYRKAELVRPNGKRAPLDMAVQIALAHVDMAISLILNGQEDAVSKVSCIRLYILLGMSKFTLRELGKQLRLTKAFLGTGPAEEELPNDEKIQRLLSFAYHTLNSRDPLGSEDRVVLSVALKVLGLSDVLPERFKLNTEIRA